MENVGMDANFTRIGKLFFFFFLLTKDEHKVEHRTILNTGIYMHLRN